MVAPFRCLNLVPGGQKLTIIICSVENFSDSMGSAKIKRTNIIVRLTAETRDRRVIDVYIVLMIIVLSYNDTR